MLKTRSCRIAMLCMSPLADYRYHNGVDDHGICMTHLTGICNRHTTEQKLGVGGLVLCATHLHAMGNKNEFGLSLCVGDIV